MSFDLDISVKQSLVAHPRVHFAMIKALLAMKPRRWFPVGEGVRETIGGKSARHTFAGLDVWVEHCGKRGDEKLRVIATAVDPGWDGKNQAGEKIGAPRKRSSVRFEIEGGKLSIVAFEEFGERKVQQVAVKVWDPASSILEAAVRAEFLSDVLHGILRALRYKERSLWTAEQLASLKAKPAALEELPSPPAAPAPPAKKARKPKKANGGGGLELTPEQRAALEAASTRLRPPAAN